MEALLPISIVVALLAGIFFQIVQMFPWLAAWPAFAAWASFFFCGGDDKALAKSYITNFSGMAHSAVFLFLYGLIGIQSPIALTIVVTVLVFVMCIEGSTKLLATIPGQFLGAAVFFGNLNIFKGTLWEVLFHTAVMMLVGNLLGIISVKITGMVQKKNPA
ncbi:MAG: DUF1097 domain-containing protein [Deltaproteobacteria bacterium]|nr:DUF1097 domain-containing protein [Deltaproteobacteria bacterium]